MIRQAERRSAAKDIKKVFLNIVEYPFAVAEFV